jgi:hypothetical protein
MKNKILFYILSLFVITNIFAKDTNFTGSVSIVGMSMDYKEYSRSGKLLDSEDTSYDDITGVEVGLGYLFAKENFSYSKIKFDFMILGGDSKYKGSYLSSGLNYGSVVSTTKNMIIDTDISYIYTQLFENNFRLNYGLGLGYRWWERSLSALQVETYKWYSLRPMLGMGMTFKNKIDLALNIEYQYGFDTIMSASDMNTDFTLGGADIWEISIPVSYKFSKKLMFCFETVFTKQDIKSSNVKSGFYEPRSTAYNNYLKLGMIYKY